jgi:hypothetical protein
MTEEAQFDSAFEQFKATNTRGSVSSHNTSYEATLTEAELREINENLKKEVERAVFTFEQYLRVAML